MSPAELERFNKATPGLWQVHGVLGDIEIVSQDSTFAPVVPIARCHYATQSGPSGAPNFEQAIANADLIVHLVNNWAEISAHLSALDRKAKASDAVLLACRERINGWQTSDDTDEDCIEVIRAYLLAHERAEAATALEAKETKDAR